MGDQSAGFRGLLFWLRPFPLSVTGIGLQTDQLPSSPEPLAARARLPTERGYGTEAAKHAKTVPANRLERVYLRANQLPYIVRAALLVPNFTGSMGYPYPSDWSRVGDVMQDDRTEPPRRICGAA